jgi:hypothetical protein
MVRRACGAAQRPTGGPRAPGAAAAGAVGAARRAWCGGRGVAGAADAAAHAVTPRRSHAGLLPPRCRAARVQGRRGRADEGADAREHRDPAPGAALDPCRPAPHCPRGACTLALRRVLAWRGCPVPAPSTASPAPRVLSSAADIAHAGLPAASCVPRVVCASRCAGPRALLPSARLGLLCWSLVLVSCVGRVFPRA